MAKFRVGFTMTVRGTITLDAESAEAAEKLAESEGGLLLTDGEITHEEIEAEAEPAAEAA
jgi:hypothetical protein